MRGGGGVGASTLPRMEVIGCKGRVCGGGVGYSTLIVPGVDLIGCLDWTRSDSKGYSTLPEMRFIGPKEWVCDGDVGYSTLILPGLEAKRLLDWARDFMRYSSLPGVGFIADVIELGS